MEGRHSLWIGIVTLACGSVLAISLFSFDWNSAPVDATLELSATLLFVFIGLSYMTQRPKLLWSE
jgi:hypothetical protein